MMLLKYQYVNSGIILLDRVSENDLVWDILSDLLLLPEYVTVRAEHSFVV